MIEENIKIQQQQCNQIKYNEESMQHAMNSPQDPLHFLADIVTNSTSSNDSFENNNYILTQPPEVTTADNSSSSSSSTMDTNHDMSKNAADPSSIAKKPSTRKSKLKKHNRQSPKSVLETMTSETARTATTTAAAATASQNVSTSSASRNTAASKTSCQFPPSSSVVGAGRSMTGSSKVINSAQLLSRITIGAKIGVYWPDDDKYYPCTVAAHQRGNVYTIHYDDGEVETVDLATEKFRIVGLDETTTTTTTTTTETTGDISRIRTTLEELRQSHATDGNPESIQRILAILRNDLGKRGDITFHTLLHTGIGKTVNKLAKHENTTVRKAAIPILHKWKKIDQSTPDDVKAAAVALVVKAAAAGTTNAAVGPGGGAGAVATTSNGMPKTPIHKAAAVTSPPPVTPANNDMIDLTDSPPPPSKVQRDKSQLQRRRAPSSRKRKATAKSTSKITPDSVKNVEEGDGNREKMSSAPPPPELESSSSFKENDVMVPSGKKSKGGASADDGANDAALTTIQPKTASTEQATSNDAKSGASSSDAKIASATAMNANDASVKEASSDKSDAKQTSNDKNASLPTTADAVAANKTSSATPDAKRTSNAKSASATTTNANALSAKTVPNAKPAANKSRKAKAESVVIPNANAANARKAKDAKPASKQTSNAKAASATTSTANAASAKKTNNAKSAAKEASNAKAASATTTKANDATAKKANNAKPAAKKTNNAKTASATTTEANDATAKKANNAKSAAKKTSDAKTASASTTKTNDATAKKANNVNPAAKQSSNASPASSNTATVTTNPTPPKKKKRSFHDQILYTMLTTCKPYTLKSLAKDTNTTVEGLRHAMLSFLDKQLVICKEFPGKKGSSREPKKLYWANPMTLMEVENGRGGSSDGKGRKGGGGGAVVKELTKLLSTSAEIEEARGSRQQLERQHRALQGELTPLLAIPTMKELDEQISAEEQKLQEVQNEIQAVKDRMANASKPPSNSTLGGGRMSSGGYATAAHYPPSRFQKRPPPKTQDPSTLKRKINHMLGEYKTRKRKCMDFVEELSDAMEKKTKDVLGEKVLGLDTDEMEWGCYEDESTGKVFGTKTKPKGGRGGLLGRKNNGPVGLGNKDNEDTEISIVKIPAKYRDV